MTDSPRLLLDMFELTSWLLERTAQFPRRFRASLTQRIETNALIVLEALTAAQYSRQPAGDLLEASRALDRLRILLRLAHRLRVLDTRRYEHVAETLTESGRMLGGWLRHSGSAASAARERR